MADIANSTFVQKYKRDMLATLTKLKPDTPIEELEALIDEQITNNEKLNSDENNIKLVNNYEKVENECTLLDILDFYENKNPIMTGYGVMFKQHEKAINLNADFVSWLMSERKVAKKAQFAALNEGDIARESFYEMMQKTFKLLNNSYYGATGEKNSQFYNPVIPASVTYTGYAIITTSILAFESFLSNNVHYDNFNDLCIYINNCLENTNKNMKILKYLDSDKVKKKQDLLNKLMEVIDVPLSKDEKSALKNLINGLDRESVNRVYYKNNIYEFLENEKVKCYLENILQYEIIDPNEINDDTKKNLDNLWDLLEEFVVYDYQYWNRAERAFNMERSTILTVDTDSNFLNLDPYVKWVHKTIQLPDSDKLMYSIPNSAILFLAKFIQKELNRLTANCNVTEVKQPIINMKSEFLYSRLMLTRNKKQYAGQLELQEGNIKRKIDMKGMSIKKANVNNRTRKVFTDLIEKKILNAKEINIAEILGIFKAFEDEIRTSLQNGEITFLTPGKCNDFDSYKNVYQVASARGSIIWNKLNPDNTIQTPAKVNLLKLSINDISDLEPIYETEMFNTIQTEIFGDEKLAHYGMTAICMPKSVTKIPDWLIPFINYEDIIDDNIRVGNLLLESLGIKLMQYNNKEYYSTFVSF